MKKNVFETMNKHYPFQEFEPLFQGVWDHVFKPSPGGEKSPYSIAMPPPNVTGSLHLGHTLSSTIQDILIRFHKAKGRDVYWIPGTDHAGIATQMMVEKELATTGTTRQQLGREAFLERVWQWKDRYQERIVHQMKRLGFAADWSSLKFTLDADVSQAVIETFVTLHEEGLIYRARRLVNWDPALETAVSDLEVEGVEEKGSLWTLRYDVEGGGSICVATTRPETMFGDTAIAVHPEDERYRALIGKHAWLPLTERRILIVADTAVSLDKGTGAVKVTPAHDFLDFEIGQRHELDMINIFDEKACLNDQVPEAFRGMERYTARQAVLEALGERVVCQESIQHSIPVSQRSGVVVEPRLTEQWFMDTADMAQKALDAVRGKDCQFVPPMWESTFFEWLENIRPWCLSRQLWWGHRIPAWYDAQGRYFVGRCAEEAEEKARAAGSGGPLIQDSDVLDTWFSSGLWPFSILGWPGAVQEKASKEEKTFYQTYYPNNVLVTGFDIIFFWVARMLMLGLKMTDQVPFRHVYIHPLICDESGKKMSKTKGNVIDPMDIADQYGADALRFAVAMVATPSRYTAFGIKHVEQARNFMTKIWNAGRFLAMHNMTGASHLPEKMQEDMNQWMVGQVKQWFDNVGSLLQSYRFHEAALAVYHGVWSSFCDWYIEWVKDQIQHENNTQETRQVMGWVFNQVLILIQPFAPFMAQLLWQKQNPADESATFGESPSLVCQQSWLETQDPSCEQDNHVNTMISVITAFRQIRNEFKIPFSQQIPLVLSGISGGQKAFFERQIPFMIRMLRLASLELQAQAEPDRHEEQCLLPVANLLMHIPLSQWIDMDAERARLQKKLDKEEAQYQSTKDRLSDQNFLEKASETAVASLRQRFEEQEQQMAHLKMYQAFLTQKKEIP